MPGQCARFSCAPDQDRFMPSRFRPKRYFQGLLWCNDLVRTLAAFRDHAAAHYAKVILSDGARMALLSLAVLAKQTEANKRHQEKARARPTKSHQRGRSRHLGAWVRDGIRLLRGPGGRHRDHAVQKRRAASGQISAEAPDDRADQPTAPARNAVLSV